MITKVYEVTCDYCCTAIVHDLGTLKTAKKRLLSVGGFYKGGHHFCDKDCYKKWLENNKRDIIGGTNG